MNFDDLVVPTDLFLDANIFIYHFTSDPKWGAACTRLQERIELRELRAFTATHVLGDVVHRLMTLEAMDLRQHHAEIPKLSVYQQSLVKIAQIGIQVLPVLELHIIQASHLSHSHQLLIGDAVIVAVMQANGLPCLASNDADFDRVPHISRYAPA
jgi:predicted nucleic acid-binding protein